MVTNGGRDMKHGNLRSIAVLLSLICGLIASPVIFAEVYRWTDENGVTHFSQTPPPEGQDAEIEDLPVTPPAEGADQAAGIDFDGAGNAGGETMSAAEERRQELAEARARQRSEAQALETACAEARTRLARVEPSRRVFYTNEQGETVRMDDEQRVAEVEQLRDFLAGNCP